MSLMHFYSLVPQDPLRSALPRSGHSLTTCTNNDHVAYMFGGYSLLNGGDGGALGDLWRLDLETNEWTLLYDARDGEEGPRPR